MALAAIGGYGRAELNPHSDIDFMVLHNRQLVGNRPHPYLSKMVEGIYYPLLDIGLKIGHSVRSVDDCVKVANSDMQSKTSLIESRLIAGDETLFQKFQRTLVSKSVEGYEDEYIKMRIEDQDARRAKFGNSACMQEPNVKNGCGGLRDFQNLLWMTFFKYRTRSLKDLQQHALIGDSERKQLEAAYDFLLRVRTEMHYHTDRATDVLSKNIQPAIAFNLGYHERSPSKRIESFMRDLYTHFRSIFLITRMLEQRMALLPRPPPSLLSIRSWLPGGKKPAPSEPFDGFKFIDGEIHAASNRVFRDQPRRLMRVFLYAQQRGLRLHPDLFQLIRNHLSLVDRAFLSDEHVRESFLAILGQRGSVAPILRAMHDVDLLGKYVPEFGKLTCLVQHEFYHQYAADEHTLMCIEQLDRIWEAKEPPYNTYAPLFHGLERPFVLYLALLLHDVGKPEGHGNHSEVSAKLAQRVARRLALDPTATQTLLRLIEHHLLMANVSQRRDLDDPAVIRQFARQVENTETLNLLTLHTFADTLATSDKLWNGFKDQLLWTLHLKATQLMSGGTEFIRAEEKQREMLLEEVGHLLPEGIENEELQAHFATLPSRYFQIHSARDIVNDLLLTHRFMRQQISEEDTALTRTDGIVLDTFFVIDARTGNLSGAEQRDKFESVLNRALSGEGVDFHPMILKQKLVRPAYHAYTGERIPTQVRFDNEASETRTLIEIETEDRIGLLYEISQTFSELDLDISAAKISTEKGAAIDTFYIRELEGSKVVSSERHRAIERRLRQAIQSLDSR